MGTLKREYREVLLRGEGSDLYPAHLDHASGELFPLVGILVVTSGSWLLRPLNANKFPSDLTICSTGLFSMNLGQWNFMCSGFLGVVPHSGQSGHSSNPKRYKDFLCVFVHSLCPFLNALDQFMGPATLFTIIPQSQPSSIQVCLTGFT